MRSKNVRASGFYSSVFQESRFSGASSRSLVRQCDQWSSTTRMDPSIRADHHVVRKLPCGCLSHRRNVLRFGSAPCLHAGRPPSVETVAAAGGNVTCTLLVHCNVRYRTPLPRLQRSDGNFSAAFVGASSFVSEFRYAPVPEPEPIGSFCCAQSISPRATHPWRPRRPWNARISISALSSQICATAERRPDVAAPDVALPDMRAPDVEPPGRLRDYPAALDLQGGERLSL